MMMVVDVGIAVDLQTLRFRYSTCTYQFSRDVCRGGGAKRKGFPAFPYPALPQVFQLSNAGLTNKKRGREKEGGTGRVSKEIGNDSAFRSTGYGGLGEWTFVGLVSGGELSLVSAWGLGSRGV